MLEREGAWLELKYSQFFHHDHIPCLISPLVLRDMNMGQIDLAFLTKKNGKFVINIAEIKRSMFPSKKQLLRLKRSVSFLADVLEMESNFFVIEEKSNADNNYIK